MMTDDDLRQMYADMAEKDCDGSLEVLERAAAQYEADAKKNDFLNSIPPTKTETNTGDSQTKEKATTT